jgi:hypothetical protein
MIEGFTPAERDYIRRELDQFFSTLPSVADGFQLKTWRGGPQALKAILDQAVQVLSADPSLLSIRRRWTSRKLCATRSSDTARQGHPIASGSFGAGSSRKASPG